MVNSNLRTLHHVFFGRLSFSFPTVRGRREKKLKMKCYQEQQLLGRDIQMQYQHAAKPLTSETVWVTIFFKCPKSSVYQQIQSSGSQYIMLQNLLG